MTVVLEVVDHRTQRSELMVHRGPFDHRAGFAWLLDALRNRLDNFRERVRLVDALHDFFLQRRFGTLRLRCGNVTPHWRGAVVAVQRGAVVPVRCGYMAAPPAAHLAQKPTHRRRPPGTASSPQSENVP